ncbi:hypothetical protein H6761_01685 [Candidatus Nomurabacteria bacterium]|nr:hypothetical protein [Candidatus Nomurabacteria bacterium]
MKKYLFILSFSLFFIAFKVEAKLIPFQNDQEKIQVTDGIFVNILEIDDASKNWVLSWEEKTGLLKIYPSQKYLKYSLVDQNNQLLQDAEKTTDHQILVQVKPKTEEVLNLTSENIEIVRDNQNFSQEFRSEDSFLEVEADQNLIISKVMAPIQNGDLERISKFYKIANFQNANLKFHYQVEDFRSKNIYYYDYSNNKWTALVGYNDVEEKFISAQVRNNDQDLVVAIFADPKAEDGIASFYDQSRYRYFNYQNGNFAASRDYPKGTKLKVTRLKTGKSIIIEVNDYGPELQTGRIIDLDTEAFKQLSSLGAGLIYVKVEFYDQSN